MVWSGAALECWRAAVRPCGGSGRNFAADQLFHLLAGPERNHPSFGYGHLIAGARVAADAACTRFHLKYAKIAQFPPLALGKCLRYGIECPLNNFGHIALGHAERIGNPDYEFALCHCHRAGPSISSRRRCEQLVWHGPSTIPRRRGLYGKGSNRASLFQPIAYRGYHLLSPGF